MVSTNDFFHIPLSQTYEELCTEKALQVDSSQQEAIAAIESFSSNVRQKRYFWQRDVSQRCLYIYGPVGRGKTMLMDMAYANAVGTKNRMHYHDLMRDIRQQLAQLRGKNPMERVAVALAPQGSLFCIDELHIPPGPPPDVDAGMVLRLLFQEFLKNNVIVIGTSNFPPREVLPLYTDLFHVVEIGAGTDYRRLTGNGESQLSQYFVDDDREDLIRSIFEQRSGSAEQLSEEIPVFDRSIKCIARTETVLWFDFKVICKGFYSSRCYFEILKGVSTICLSGVSITAPDEARRFAWLVEMVYDMDIDLIVSAEKHPDDLFIEFKSSDENYVMEYDRVSSRLVELTSAQALDVRR